MKVTEEAGSSLKSYVYVYIDPFDDRPFYIGKGKGDRAFAHLRSRSESDKVEKIRKIRSRGEEPRVEFLRYGLTDAEACLVEAAAIDLIGKENLTNCISGHHSGSFGRTRSEELVTITNPYLQAQGEQNQKKSFPCLLPHQLISAIKRSLSQLTSSIGAI